MTSKSVQLSHSVSRPAPRSAGAAAAPSQATREATESSTSQAATPQSAMPDPATTEPASSEPRDWTVLLYLDGNNDIERDVLNAFLTAEQVSRMDRVTVAAELGRAPQSMAHGGYADNVDGDWTGVRRYVLDPGPPASPYDPKVWTSNGEHNGRIDSPVVADLGAADMSKTSTLKDFLTWGMRSYPAKHYMVVLADHGMGYLGTLTDQVARGEMRLPDLHQALSEVRQETGIKPDLLVMDACLMGATEAVAELHEDAKLYVASEEVNFDNYPLQATLKKLGEAQAAGTTLEPRELGQAIIDGTQKRESTYPYISMVDLERVKPLVDAIKDLADCLLKAPVDPGQIKMAFRNATHFSQDASGVKPYDDYRDLAQLAAGLAKVDDAQVKAAARRVEDLVRQDTVLFARGRRPDEKPVGGLSIYAPLSGFQLTPGADYPIGTKPSDLEPVYKDLAFTAETGWDRVLERFAEKPEPVERRRDPFGW